MPAIAEYSGPSSAVVWEVPETEWSLQPQGDEGRQLFRKANESLQHWGERTAVLINTIDADNVAYVSAPPNRTIYVKTRYVFAGKGEPLPFELEDE